MELAIVIIGLISAVLAAVHQYKQRKHKEAELAPLKKREEHLIDALIAGKMAGIIDSQQVKRAIELGKKEDAHQGDKRKQMRRAITDIAKYGIKKQAH